MNNVTIPSMLDANLKGKTVLVRMDHNVVKKGKIKDPMRIDATIPTLLHLYKMGAFPVLMSHVGRPFDKASGKITISDAESVKPIVEYLQTKLKLKGFIAECVADGDQGIKNFEPIAEAINKMKSGNCDFVYLPNTRWFAGEEAKDEKAEIMAKGISQYADVYINDAFGSWQAHCSTIGFPKYLPSFAGLLMIQEIDNLQAVFEPKKPLLSIVAGSKFDTKIGPLSSLIRLSDYLVLGGVLYNAYLCVKYDIKIKGVGQDDIEMARKFISDSDAYLDRIVELPFIVESDSFEERNDSSYRVHDIRNLKAGTELNFVLDASPLSLDEAHIKEVFMASQTIFINAVMGYTTLFGEGSVATYKLIDKNSDARKLFGGGDTIQDFRDLLPGIFAKASNDSKYYFFTGGGAILDAIQNGSAYQMKPIQALLQQKA